VLFALLLLSGPACFNPALPADTAIACGGDGDCPDGLVCAGFLERCVAASGGDRVAPGVASSTLSARRLGGDGVLVVTLTPDEPTLDGSVLQVADRTWPSSPTPTRPIRTPRPAPLAPRSAWATSAMVPTP